MPSSQLKEMARAASLIPSQGPQMPLLEAVTGDSYPLVLNLWEHRLYDGERRIEAEAFMGAYALSNAHDAIHDYDAAPGFTYLATWRITGRGWEEIPFGQL